jgi:hypothetical protein
MVLEDPFESLLEPTESLDTPGAGKELEQPLAAEHMGTNLVAQEQQAGQQMKAFCKLVLQHYEILTELPSEFVAFNQDPQQVSLEGNFSEQVHHVDMKDQEELNTEDQVHESKETVQGMIKEHILPC